MTYGKTWPLMLALIFVVAMPGCSGDNKIADFDLSTLLNGSGDPVAATSGFETPEVEAPRSLPGVACQVDPNGNCYKLICCSQGATLTSFDGLIRDVPMMEKQYLFNSTSTHHEAGPDPRATAEGQIAKGNCFVTPTMQWIRFLDESASFRKPVVGYASRDDIDRIRNGEKVVPALTEQALGKDRSNAWMPILSSEEITVGRTTVQLLELGAWTLREDAKTLKTADREFVRNPQEHLKKVSLVVVVDATSSMHPAWQAIHEHLNAIVESCFDGNLECEIAFVAYRDSDELSEWSYRKTEFSSNVDKVREWTGYIKTLGGGDWEEQMFEAMEVAVDMLDDDGRRQSYKSILVVADNAGKVHESTDDVLGFVGRNVLQRCINEGISVSTLQCPYHHQFGGDQGLLPAQFEEMTNATFGTSIDLNNHNAETSVAIESQFEKAFSRTATQVYEELEIATRIAAGDSPTEIANAMNLPASALAWRMKNIDRRSNHGRLAIDERRTLGLERVWVIFDPNSMETGVLMRKEELDTLQQITSTVLDHGVEKPESLVPVFESIAGGYIGDGGISISDALRIQGIPVKANLLALTCTELVLMPRAQRLEWKEAIEIRLHTLTDFAQRNRPDLNGNYIIPISIMP